MITIRFSGRTPTPGVIGAGMETDQEAEKIRFILPQIADGQTAQLCMMLPDNSPEVLRIADGLVTLPKSVTEIPGRSRAWVEILGTDTVAWNSEIFYMDVGDLPPISETIERTYPTLLMEAIAAGEKARNAAEAAQAALSLVIAHSRIVHIRVENETLIIQSARLDDENAYTLAVLNGYEGTEEEWDGYIETLSNGNWTEEAAQQAEQAAELAQTALETAQSKTKAKHAQISITIGDWTGESAPYTALKACDIVKSTDKIIVGIGESATGDAQREIAKAQITCVSQGTGTLTFRALGDKPGIAVPVNVLALEG